MTAPNTRIETLTGSGAEVVKISTQYKTNVITITGVTAGKVSMKIKKEGNAGFESLINDQLNVAFDRTLIIRDAQIDSIQFTITPTQAYIVKIKQTDADTER